MLYLLVMDRIKLQFYSNLASFAVLFFYFTLSSFAASSLPDKPIDVVPFRLSPCQDCETNTFRTNSAEDKPVIALVLSGGGARGLAHVGVLKAIEEIGLPIDIVTGTSIGALIGGLWSTGWTADEIEQMSRQIDWNEYYRDQPSHNKLYGNARFYDAGEIASLDWDGKKLRPPNALIHGQKIDLLIADLTTGFHGHQNFLDFPRAFACVATDLESGEAVYMTHGSLSKSIRASLSLPSIFDPVTINNRVLVDGGLVQNMPVELARKLGADIVIAVKLPSPLRPRTELNSLIDIAEQSRQILSLEQEIRQSGLADIVVVPDVSHVGLLEFDEISEIRNRGFEAVMLRQYTLENLTGNATSNRTPSLAVATPIKAEEYVLGNVVVVGSDIIDDERGLWLLKLEKGDVFQAKNVSRRVMEIAGRGISRKITYELLLSKYEQAAAIDTADIVLFVEDDTGVSVDLMISYDRIHNGVFGSRVNWKSPSGPGSFLRLDGRVGSMTGLNVDYWQSSFRNTGFYWHPGFAYKNRSIYIHDDDGNRTASYRDRSLRGSLGGGFILRKGARDELGVYYESIRAVPDVADSSSAWTRVTNVAIGAFARLEIDTRDKVDLPSKGYLLTADLRNSRKFAGADYDSYRATVSAKFWHPLRKPLGRVNSSRRALRENEKDLRPLTSRLVIEGGVLGETGFEKGLPVAKYFNNGGWPFLPGLKTDERWVEEHLSTFLGLRYWFNNSISCRPTIGWSKIKGRLTNPEVESTTTGWGIDVSARTLIGPVVIAVGDTRGRAPEIYIKIGYQ
jgi:NTE family protein